jgi:hypothetical protein
MDEVDQWRAEQNRDEESGRAEQIDGNETLGPGAAEWRHPTGRAEV